MHVVKVQGDGDAGRNSHIENMEILPGNFENTRGTNKPHPQNSFVGVAWKFSTPKRYQF